MNPKYINSLAASFNEEPSLGLARGKAGFSIFLFWLARLGYREYQSIAEDLLDEVFEELDTMDNIDIPNGLAGIGLVLNHLLKKGFVKGNTNVLLSGIDDIIFKQLSYPKYKANTSPLIAIQILYYLYIRLKDQKKHSELEYLLQELVIQTVNNVYQKLEPKHCEESFPYSINSLLPQFLFVLSKIYELGFYNIRITKILEELSLTILSKIPILHTNRLNLLWGINAINKQVNMRGWSKHAVLLRQGIDVKHILNDELKSRNIYFANGFSGIFTLLYNLKDHFTKDELTYYHNSIIKKIENSDVWAVIDDDSTYLTNNNGLLSGLSGVLLFLEVSKHNQYAL